MSRLAVLCLLAALILTGCSDRQAPWTRDDPDGVAVPVTVRFEPGFLDSPLVREWRRGDDGPRVRFSFGVGVGIGSHPRPYPSPYPYGFYDPWWGGPSDPPTVFSLLIGDGPAQGQVMRWRLVRGTQEAALRLRPGRVVTVSVRATGRFEGFESLGTATIAAGDALDIVLDEQGGRLRGGPATASGPATSAMPGL